MADLETTTNVPKQRHVWRNVAMTLLLTMVIVAVGVIAMFSTDRGSKFLLDRVLERQQIIRYEYEGGNLWNGLILKNIAVVLESVDVNIDRADVTLGWRAILNKEIHLNHADIQNLHIINKKPPSDEPFGFSKIALPFVLRVDQLDADRLIIQTQTTKVNFYDIHLNDGLWSDTKLTFANTDTRMDYLSIKNAKGEMTFDNKYPLKVEGIVNLPSLHNSLNIHDIYVVAGGTLDTIEAGVATRNPDLVTGWTVLHPVRKDVPMFGALNFKNYHWPFVQEQKLFTETGMAKFKGDIKRLDIDAITDLVGKDIPKGQYNAILSTDLVNQLNIQQLNAQVLKGAVNLTGILSWKDQVSWDAQGRMDGIDHKDPWIPQVVRDFLPPQTDAEIRSKGYLKDGLHLDADVNFDRYENWHLDLHQAATQNKKAQPMNLDVSWRGIDRAVPYVGWLKSASGNAKLTLLEGQQNIHVATAVTRHDQGMLPEGQYQAQLNLRNNVLNIPSFQYQTAQGRLDGQAKVQLPHEKQLLKWDATLNAQNFNPQTIASVAPVNLLNGQIQAHGYAGPNQQIIQLKQVNLLGQLAEQKQTVRLTGHSGIAVFFHDQKQGGGFKSFAVNYDGHLNASHIAASQGILKARISGTPQRINLSELYHQGVAGNIRAQGYVDLNQTLGWDIQASLADFKPQYVMSSLNGNLSGEVKTQGVWTEQQKRISIQQLKLNGILNQKPISGSGNLAVSFKAGKEGVVPERFEANQFNVSYANNRLQATGSAQQLNLNIDAPALYELYPGLRGRVYGNMKLKVQPRFSAVADLAVDNFGYERSLSIRQMRLKGELPTSNVPTVLNASLESLRSGQHEIQKANISLRGTRQGHLLLLDGHNRLSQLKVQLAGGLNQNNQWLGQIQDGQFKSRRTNLTQQQHASIVFDIAKKELWMGAHCWASKQSQICVDQPLRASPQSGNVSLLTKNVNLNDFAAFMPDGLVLTGQLNGYAKASWAKGNKPKIDASLITRQGTVGLTGDDPELSSTLSYEQVALVAKSVPQGLQMRLDLSAKDIGAGYANVIIDPYQSNKPMQGSVAFKEIDLKILRPFIQDVRRLEGSLSVGGKISGTLTQPTFNGDLRLKNGEISMASLPVNLNNIQVYSAIRENRATIDGGFNSGRGAGQLTGFVDWKAQPHIHLNLEGQELYVRQAPLVSALVSPKVTMNLYPTARRLDVSGDIQIPRALISMPEASAPVVNVSSDVRIVREGQNQLAILEAAKPWNITADVNIALQDQVVFQGFDSRIPLGGRLYLSQRGKETAMRANGAIGVRSRVKIEAYGQSLDLNRAIARFNGPLYNPTLDVDANKSVQGSLVGFRVTGTATRPNIQIYNDAGLSEQEALNALITGRINDGSSGISQTEGFKSDVNNTIAAAGISMGLGGTRALTNQIGRTLGLSSLALDAQGTGDDTQVSLTGYITPDLFLRYGVGVFTPVNKLTLRYQINKRLYLEASQELERAIDVFYHWRY